MEVASASLILTWNFSATTVGRHTTKVAGRTQNVSSALCLMCREIAHAKFASRSGHLGVLWGQGSRTGLPAKDIYAGRGGIPFV